VELATLEVARVGLERARLPFAQFESRPRCRGDNDAMQDAAVPRRRQAQRQAVAVDGDEGKQKGADHDVYAVHSQGGPPGSGRTRNVSLVQPECQPVDRRGERTATPVC